MSRPLAFKSKIDTWLLVVVLVAVAAFVLGADALINSRLSFKWVAVVALCLVGVVLPLWILMQTRYLLSDVKLTVRCGPFRWSIPIAEISSVSSIRSAAQSPALSVDRLQIDYGDGRSIMISPDNRDIFLRSLEARRAEAGAG